MRLPHYYNAADISVLASSREGWANVLLESMACGTPVVASNIPGNPEVVRERAAGLIVAQNTPRASPRRCGRCSAAPAVAGGDAGLCRAVRLGGDQPGQLALFRRVIGGAAADGYGPTGDPAAGSPLS